MRNHKRTKQDLVQEFLENEKNNLRFWIARTETYSKEKVFEECMSAGTTEEVSNRISDEIDNVVENGIYMSNVRPLIFAFLHRLDPAAAIRFKTPETYVRTSAERFERFNKEKIAESLVRETGLSMETSDVIAAETESFIKKLNLSYVSSQLIREIVCVKLLEHGLESERKSYTRLGMPVYDITQMINRGVATDIKRENANLQHTPETINWIISGETLEQYYVTKVLPRHLADPHISGDYHIHMLSNIATRPNCMQHYPPSFFKHGLRADGSGRHTSVAGPAKHLTVAIQHCAKIMLAGQTQMAGGQSIDCFNVWLAPFIKGLSQEEIRQAAQEFIYELNQSYVARGGQVVFSNVNFEIGIPDWLKDVPAIGPKGEIVGTYGDYEEEALSFLKEYVKLKIEGDYTKKQHMFPNDVFKVRKHNFSDTYSEELDLIHKFIAKYGTPYIANCLPEWQTENVSYMGCLAEDTLLPYFNDGGEHMSPIKELAEKYFKMFGEKKFGISSYTEPKNNLMVWSWNKESNKMEKKRVLKIIKNPAAQMLTIKTTKGKEIKVTKDHPFYRVSRKKYWLKGAEEVPAGKLNVGDRLLVPRKLADCSNATPASKAELFGFFAGDGTILNPETSNPVVQFNFKAGSDHLAYLDDLCSRCGLKLEVSSTYHSRDKAEYVNCYIKDKTVCETFSKDAYNNNEKNVPDWILENENNMLGFLTGLINSDGYVRVVKRAKTKPVEVLITTTSNKIFNSTTLILASLGVDYSIRKQTAPGKKCKKAAYRISIFGKYAHHLLSRMPVAERHKKTQFQTVTLDEEATKSVRIKEIIETEGTGPVYDLEVEDNHTFVSGQGLFIHSNCRTRLDSKFAGPWGTLRTGNDLYITLNLPRIAYESKGNDERFFDILNARMRNMSDTLLLNHKIKENVLYTQRLLPFLSQKFDGEEYYRLENTTKTLGYCGLTEAAFVHCGGHLHESKDSQVFGEKVIKTMRAHADEAARQTGLRFSVIASPAETCAARLAKLDILRLGAENCCFAGTKEAPYYTNSHMVRMDAAIPLADKIAIEEAYHPLTNGGHITHIWLGESAPSAESLLEMSKKICKNTNIGFFAYTRDYSVCNSCNSFEYGLLNSCVNCKGEDLSRYSRITGYYQRVEGWNPSKRQELKDRYRYTKTSM